MELHVCILHVDAYVNQQKYTGYYSTPFLGQTNILCLYWTLLTYNIGKGLMLIYIVHEETKAPS